MARKPPLDHHLSVILAVAAALLAGLQLVALQPAGSIDALTGVGASRATSVLVLSFVLLTTRASASFRTLPVAAVVGPLDTAANVANTLASTRALLSLAAVLASLYPLVTVALAHTLLHERLRRTQSAGSALALIGLLLIVGGSVPPSD